LKKGILFDKKLGDAAFIKVLNFIPNDVTRLDLYNNNLGVESVKALAEKLQIAYAN
jgi:hypothetical protein